MTDVRPRDSLSRFVFEGRSVRGVRVTLADTSRALLASHDYPAPVARVLAELAGAVALLAAALKFDGSLMLQLVGPGPVRLVVVECNPGLALRGTAQWDESAVGALPGDASLRTLAGDGSDARLAITLDPTERLPGQQPYQGVVPLHGDRREPLQRVSEVLEHYMLQSEQLDTKLVLAANDEIAAGLLIQRLPVEGEGNLAGARNEDEIGLNESFNRIAHLAATLTADELLTLDADTVLRRLFWEEKVVRFEPQVPRFACTCSRERVGQMLRGLGREEVDDIVRERGDVEIGCDFCGLQYHFDAVDVGELFTPGRDQPPSSTAVQ